MTREQPKTFSLTMTQVAAGTLAAVTAAVLGSRLGVAGTMIGAALASATTTVATAVYQHSLERSGARMRSRLARPAGEVPTVPSRLAWPAGDAAPTVPSRLAREAEVADGTGGPSGRRFAVAVGAL